MTGNCLKGSRPLLSFDPVSSTNHGAIFTFAISIEHDFDMCIIRKIIATQHFHVSFYTNRNSTQSPTTLY